MSIVRWPGKVTRLLQSQSGEGTAFCSVQSAFSLMALPPQLGANYVAVTQSSQPRWLKQVRMTIEQERL